MRYLGGTIAGTVVAVLIGCAVPEPAVSQDRMAAVASTEVIFENEYVRVQWHDVEVGEAVPMHSHPPAVIIAFADSRVRFTFPGGTSRMAQATEGQAYWNEATSHEVMNVGDTPVHNLMVELRSPVARDGKVGPPSPDFLPLTAAPDQHKVLVDNDWVRVFEVVSEPGEVAPAHVHEWHSVFITASPAKLLFRDVAGAVVLEAPGVTRGEILPRVQWFGPSVAPRSVENVDTVPIRAYRIEIKRSP